MLRIVICSLSIAGGWLCSVTAAEKLSTPKEGLLVRRADADLVREKLRLLQEGPAQTWSPAYRAPGPQLSRKPTAAANRASPLAKRFEAERDQYIRRGWQNLAAEAMEVRASGTRNDRFGAENASDYDRNR